VFEVFFHLTYLLDFVKSKMLWEQ